VLCDDTVLFYTWHKYFKESVVFIFKQKVSRSEDSKGISRKECFLKGLIVGVAERRNMKNHRLKEN